MDRDEAIKKLAELMDGVHLCTLTSLDEDDQLVSRPMALQNKEFAGDLWFFTNRNSTKIAQINRRPQVNVAFQHSNSYVSISGEAQPVEDKAKAEELWTAAMKGWFPDGTDDPDLLLIRVQATSAQYWDSTSSKLVTLFAYAKAAVTGKRPDSSEIGENMVVDLEP